MADANPQVTPEAQEKIQRLQMIEQNVQQLHAQKQQFQAQLFEQDNAIKELKTAKQAYKIIGNVMLSAEPKDLQKELEERKEMLQLRIDSIDKQSSQLKDKAKALQEEVMKSMKG